MTPNLEILAAEALRLAPAERARLLERLIASLNIDPEIDAAWEREADQREAALASGAAVEVPAQDAMLRLQARLAQ